MISDHLMLPIIQTPAASDYYKTRQSRTAEYAQSSKDPDLGHFYVTSNNSLEYERACFVTTDRILRKK